MPTRIIERGTAGPAYSAATCPVITKIPAPMTAPMPSVTRLRGPSALVRLCSPVASASARRVAIGLVAKRLIRQSEDPPPPHTANWDGRDTRGDQRDLKDGRTEQVGTVAAGQAESGAALEDHDCVAVKPWLHFADAVHIDERRSADASKPLRIEPLLERAERRAEHMSRGAHVEADIVLRRLDPLDVARPHEDAAAVGLDQQAFGHRARGEPTLQFRERRAALLQIAVVVARMHHGQDRPVDEDVPMVEQREVVHELLREYERLSRRGMHQILHAHCGHELEQREIETRTQMDEEVTAEVGAIDAESASQPRDDERKEAPQIARGERGRQRLPPRVGMQRQPLISEEELHARYEPEQRPEAEPVQPTHGLLLRLPRRELRVPDAVPEVEHHPDHEPDNQPLPRPPR